MGGPAVPDGSPSSLLRRVAAVGPRTKAEQWCPAVPYARRSSAITARAASSVSTRTTRARNRDRFTSISAVASRAGTR